jgi:peptide-methionine (S)-S-oxide reductase
VCRGDTGFNEVVRISYDSDTISLRQLLEIFFAIHDPTSLNRQGNDTGTQYRSGIYYSDKDDQVVAMQFIAEATSMGHYDQHIVTEVLPLAHYWPAEDYHQNYFVNNPDQGYCTFVVAPKVRKLGQHFQQVVEVLVQPRGHREERPQRREVRRRAGAQLGVLYL